MILSLVDRSTIVKSIILTVRKILHSSGNPFGSLVLSALDENYFIMLMSRIIYVNGQYQPYARATIPIEDRGFQWGDSVYVVFAHHNGRFIDIEQHLERLKEYAAAIHFELPFAKEIIPSICKELIRQNHLEDAAIYVQLTRGVAQRVHWFPEGGCVPSMIIIARPFRFNFNHAALDQISVVSAQDIRWQRSSIKTNAALANVLLRQNAMSNQSFESWLIDGNGYITEGASSNAYIITREGVLQTRPNDGTIVAGVTRERVLELARHNNIPVIEKSFSLEEAYNAAEAFITGATSLIKAVVQIDQKPIANSLPGPLTQRIAQLYYNYCQGI
jgi:D-alanine transaminase